MTRIFHIPAKLSRGLEFSLRTVWAVFLTMLIQHYWEWSTVVAYLSPIVTVISSVMYFGLWQENMVRVTYGTVVGGAVGTGIGYLRETPWLVILLIFISCAWIGTLPGWVRLTKVMASLGLLLGAILPIISNGAIMGLFCFRSLLALTIIPVVITGFSLLFPIPALSFFKVKAIVFSISQKLSLMIKSLIKAFLSYDYLDLHCAEFNQLLVEVTTELTQLKQLNKYLQNESLLFLELKRIPILVDIFINIVELILVEAEGLKDMVKSILYNKTQLWFITRLERIMLEINEEIEILLMIIGEYFQLFTILPDNLRYCFFFIYYKICLRCWKGLRNCFSLKSWKKRNDSDFSNQSDLKPDFNKPSDGATSIKTLKKQKSLYSIPQSVEMIRIHQGHQQRQQRNSQHSNRNSVSSTESSSLLVSSEKNDDTVAGNPFQLPINEIQEQQGEQQPSVLMTAIEEQERERTPSVIAHGFHHYHLTTGNAVSSPSTDPKKQPKKHHSFHNNKSVIEELFPEGTVEKGKLGHRFSNEAEEDNLEEDDEKLENREVRVPEEEGRKEEPEEVEEEFEDVDKLFQDAVHHSFQSKELLFSLLEKQFSRILTKLLQSRSELLYLFYEIRKSIIYFNPQDVLDPTREDGTAAEIEEKEKKKGRKSTRKSKTPSNLKTAKKRLEATAATDEDVDRLSSEIKVTSQLEAELTFLKHIQRMEESSNNKEENNDFNDEIEYDVNESDTENGEEGKEEELETLLKGNSAPSASLHSPSSQGRRHHSVSQQLRNEIILDDAYDEDHTILETNLQESFKQQHLLQLSIREEIIRLSLKNLGPRGAYFHRFSILIEYLSSFPVIFEENILYLEEYRRYSSCSHPFQWFFGHFRHSVRGIKKMCKFYLFCIWNYLYSFYGMLHYLYLYGEERLSNKDPSSESRTEPQDPSSDDLEEGKNREASVASCTEKKEVNEPIASPLVTSKATTSSPSTSNNRFSRSYKYNIFPHLQEYCWRNIQAYKTAFALSIATILPVYNVFPTLIGRGFWTVLVVALIRQDNISSSFLFSYQRLEGTVIGAIFSFFIFSIFTCNSSKSNDYCIQQWGTQVIILLVWLFICGLFREGEQHGYSG
jgi:hypothetical protein